MSQFLKVALFSLTTLLHSASALASANSNETARQNSQRNILIINSYHPAYNWTAWQEQSFVSTLREWNPYIQIYTEYLDAKRVSAESFEEDFFLMLEEKYKDIPLDLIYASDDVAMEMCIRNKERICDATTPVIGSGINDEGLLDRSQDAYTSGILEKLHAKEVLSFAMEANPNASRVVILSDNTHVGHDTARNVRLEVERVCSLPIVDNPDLSWNQMLDYVAGQDENTIFLIAIYMVDAKGLYLDTSRVASELGARAKAPLYVFSEAYLWNPGATGGFVNRAEDQGREAAMLAERVLDGVPIRELPAYAISAPQWVFDYNSLERFGISQRSLPEDSLVLFKEGNFFTNNPRLALGLILGVGAQSALIIALLFNIKRRQAITRQLRDSEARMRMLIDHSPLAISISEKSGRIKLINRRYKQLTGYDVSELVTLEQAKKLLFPIHDYRQQASEAIDKTISMAREHGSSPTPLEIQATTRDGRVIEMEMYAASAAEIDFRIFNDISQSKKAMRELVAATESAMAANESKSRFLANVSHEVRTPMNGILGMVQLLRDTAINKEQEDYIDTIQDSCELLVNVINDILDLSKIEAGGMSLEMRPVCLGGFLKSVTSMAMPVIENKGLEFICDIDDALPAAIVTDPGRLKQVLLNLLMNAGKFTDYGSVTLRVKCAMTSDSKAKLLFEVSDTGVGIQADKQEKVFEPFVQIDTNPGRKQVGTGLGLSICNKIVHMMGGRITLKSEPGKGSSFSFQLPCQTVTLALPDKCVEHENTGNIAKVCPMRILIVEDNHVNQKVVQMVLRKLGYEAKIASNGVEAVDMAQSHDFDLVLMDIQMPEMDGLEATSRIRKLKKAAKKKQPKIIALTAHALGEDVRRCTEAGMDGHLPKPLRVESLRKVLLDSFMQATMNR
ncbi:MAG: response regulator [Opitutales bacterium]|nr:response regulator [Opitutales bacterium]